MPVELTPAQARALGVDVPATSRRGRTTRRALPGHGVSTCHSCGATFTTAAAETRHVAATLHARYDSHTDGVPSAT